MSQILSDYMACRFSKEQIDEAMDEAARALMGRYKASINVLSVSMNGESTSGMEIPPKDFESFISDCMNALAKKRGEGTTNSNGILINFGNRPVST